MATTFPTTCRQRALPALALLAVATLVACSRNEPYADPAARPVNVLLISPDSLRADRLQPYNPEAPPTPNLERLLARGTVYTNAWATAPWTAPAMVSVMTGLYPPSHGVTYRDDTTPSDLPTLPALLAERGYEIANFSFFSQISYFRNLGLGAAVPGLREDRVAGAFADWLARRRSERPFFAWLHLLETHLPYGATGYQAPRARITGSSGLEASQTRGTVPIGSVEFAPQDREPILELYDADVQAMDEALGEVLDALERQGAIEDTLIVFVADHGEELLDSAFDPPWVGHASTSVEARLLRQILHVPLVIAGPGVPPGERSDELVQQVDILPSVEALLGGITPKPLRVDGTVLPNLKRARVGWLGRWFQQRADRPAVFFDSSPGGNLTPPDQRGERMQGASDGACLVSQWLSEAATGEQPLQRERLDGCTPARAARLRDLLSAWRERQARQRLRLLGSTAEPPDLSAAASWEESFELLSPSAPTLRWQDTSGQIQLAWRRAFTPERSATDAKASQPGGADGALYWLQYELLGPGTVGIGLLTDVHGAFQLEQNRVTFGPLPPGFWNDVASYSPIRIRILDAQRKLRSRWYEFEVEPTI